MKANKELIKVGIYYLIDKKLDSFVDKLSLYIENRDSFMDYLFTESLPINDDVIKTVGEALKRTIPCPEELVSIDNVAIGIDYNDNQVYKVFYKIVKYYQPDNPYIGNSFPDSTHTVSKVTEDTQYIHPSQLIINN